MPSFLIKHASIEGKSIRITGSEFRHLALSLRLKAGDEIWGTDGCGYRYLVRLERFDSKEILGNICSKMYMEGETGIILHLAQAIPKQRRMDFLLEKGTELGIRKFIPLLSERSTAFPGGKRMSTKMRKWRNVVMAAMLQSDRCRLPQISPPTPFPELLEGTGDDYDMRLMAVIGGAGFPGKSMRRRVGEGMRILLIIGPEGGFSERERDRAVKSGIALFSLGDRVLRSETAGIVASSVILYECGELAYDRLPGRGEGSTPGSP